MKTNYTKSPLIRAIGLCALIALAFVLFGAFKSYGQEVPPSPVAVAPTNAPSNAQPFIAQFAAWATTYDKTKNWTNCISFDTGIATTTGQNIADKMQIKKNTGNYAYGISGQFTGVGSAFSELQASVDYFWVNKYDFKFGLEFDAGYNFEVSNQLNKNCFVLEPGLTMMKLITENTYATMTYSYPIKTVGKFNTISTIYVGAGFTF